jgi:HECT-domain (ubiquitin-transferase)
VGRGLINSPQMRWFWEVVGEMSQQERGLLLRFCTGCSRLGAGGFSSLQPKFAITLVPYDPSRALPTAATCFNLLRLPLYPDRVTLRKAVTTAMLYGSAGFTFS